MWANWMPTLIIPGAKIGTLRESGKIKLEFSSGFRIEQLPKTADNLIFRPLIRQLGFR